MTTSARASLRGARRYLAARPRVTDVALGVVITVLYLAVRVDVTARFGVPAPGGWPGTLLLFGTICLSAVPLVWRRSRPWTVLGVVSAAHLAVEVVDPSEILSLGPLVLGVAVHAVGRHAPGPRSAAAAAVGTAVLVVADLDPRYQLVGVEVVTAAAVFGGIWLLGSGQRRIRADAARLLALSERLRAEQVRSAERAVVAERARIARDLHDVVAHHVSAIVVQAHAVQTVGDSDPRLVSDGVRDIGEAADSALVEMRRMLGLLADRGPAGEVPPEPSLGHLDRLAQSVRAAGCQVEVTVNALAAEPGVVPPAVQVSAYRIVQEACTNVIKHASPTHARLEVDVRGEVLTVTVVSGPPVATHAPVGGSGLGLIGMRERAAVFGGTLRAGPLDDGGWRVHATFPIPRRPLVPDGASGSATSGGAAG